ncbi:uncharacterized protein LOC124896268 [Capsicum annuum]|uniref:uncharacterized protein LOC124896268 n=1 Tax=Capsicum annuum TaxID=4072 RepID=UPI001FB093C5|nr:uncharacterized protein LOC124896268 [Capsicum annuum]
MVIAWITNSLSTELATSVMCFDSAKDIWTDINEWFGQSNGTKYIQIQKEINSTVQGSSTISSYFTKIRTLWDELSTSYVGPVCTCGALGKFMEQQKLFQFFSGLNDEYSLCKSNLLMRPTLPSLSCSYAMLQHIEKQNETSPPICGFSNDSTVFNSMSQNTSVGRGYNQRFNFDSKRPFSSPVPYDARRTQPDGRKSLTPNSGPSTSSPIFCKYCKKSGHLIDKCYKLHGYPTDFKPCQV